MIKLKVKFVNEEKEMVEGYVEHYNAEAYMFLAAVYVPVLRKIVVKSIPDLIPMGYISEEDLLHK